MLFHLSRNPFLDKLTPREVRTDTDYEVRDPKRTSFSTSIQLCLLGICDRGKYGTHFNEKLNTSDLVDVSKFQAAMNWNLKKADARKMLMSDYDDMDRENLAAFIDDPYRHTYGVYPVFYVYVPKYYEPDKFVPAEVRDLELKYDRVYDGKLTNEYWCTEEIEVERIGAILLYENTDIWKLKFRPTNKNMNASLRTVTAYSYHVLPADYIDRITLYKLEHNIPLPTRSANYVDSDDCT